MRPRIAVVATLLPVLPAQAPSRELAEIAAAYAAKITASAIFVSGRTLESVLAEELAPTRAIEAMIRPLLRFDVDREHGSVTCHLGAVVATAVTTRNLGCTLVRADAPIESLRQRGAPMPAAAEPDPATIDWPLGDRLTKTDTGIDLAALASTVDAAFVEHAGKPRINTRAIVVLHRGQLVMERYGQGYDKDMPLPGWSMTKSLSYALVQLAIHDGTWRLIVPEWQQADDVRRHITTQQLQAMTSGLAWSEDYEDPSSDALRMLFRSSDHGATFATKPPVALAGSRYAYSSGSTNLLCRSLRRCLGDDRRYWAFPQQLFRRLGMQHALIETDPSGTFVGSSYGYATARDWARLGLLFQQHGRFAGERVLPAIDFEVAGKAAPGSNGHYGTGVWLNADPDGDGPATREWPDLPADLLSMDGHEGQYCVAFPDQELVVVRLGCTKNGGFDIHGLLSGVLHAAAGK